MDGISLARRREIVHKYKQGVSVTQIAREVRAQWNPVRQVCCLHDRTGNVVGAPNVSKCKTHRYCQEHYLKDRKRIAIREGEGPDEEMRSSRRLKGLSPKDEITEDSSDEEEESSQVESREVSVDPEWEDASTIATLRPSISPRVSGGFAPPVRPPHFQQQQPTFPRYQIVGMGGADGRCNSTPDWDQQERILKMKRDCILLDMEHTKYKIQLEEAKRSRIEAKRKRSRKS